MSAPNPDDDGQLLHGQLLDKDFRTPIPYTQRIRNFNYGGQSPAQGDANTEITVLGAGATEDKVFDYTGLDAAKLALFYKNIGFTSFQLPEVLTGLTSVFSTSKGVGAGLSVPTAASAGTSWSVGVSASNHAVSSLDYVPDLIPTVTTYDTSNVPCIECYFFTSGNKTLADILTLLTAGCGASVLVWPSFRPKRRSFTMKGQSLSLSSTANASLAASASAANTTLSENSGYDYSINTKTSIRSLDLPPYLNGSITISPSTASDTLTVTAASTIVCTGSVSGTATGGTTVPTQTVSASITPSSISATSPAAIPTSGLYLKEIRPQFSDGDLFLQLAIVVDFAYFA